MQSLSAVGSPSGLSAEFASRAPGYKVHPAKPSRAGVFDSEAGPEAPAPAPNPPSSLIPLPSGRIPGIWLLWGSSEANGDRESTIACIIGLERGPHLERKNRRNLTLSLCTTGALTDPCGTEKNQQADKRLRQPNLSSECIGLVSGYSSMLTAHSITIFRALCWAVE